MKQPPTLIRASLLLSLGLLGAAAAQAQQDPDFVQQQPSAPAALGALRLPAPPLSQNLLPIKLSADLSLHYLVDPASVSIDGANLVSYTLVARSAAGFANISYESIDCDSGSWRLLAVLEARGWRQVGNATWREVGSHALPHGALAQDYLCRNHAAAGTAAEIVQSLRQGLSGDLGHSIE